MKLTREIWDDPNELATFAAAVNTLLGLPMAYITVIAIFFPPLLLIPLVGYGLLFGYWRRVKTGEPQILLWGVTVLFNLAGVLFWTYAGVTGFDMELIVWLVLGAGWAAMMTVLGIRAGMLDRRLMAEREQPNRLAMEPG